MAEATCAMACSPEEHCLQPGEGCQEKRASSAKKRRAIKLLKPLVWVGCGRIWSGRGLGAWRHSKMPGTAAHAMRQGAHGSAPCSVGIGTMVRWLPALHPPVAPPSPRSPRACWCAARTAQRAQRSAHLLTVCTGTEVGKPARNMAIRHSLARWLEGPITLPKHTSPTACRSGEGGGWAHERAGR